MKIFVLDLHCCPGHFLCEKRFLPDLPPKPGCFPAATPFSPGFMVLSGTFPFCGNVFSRIYPQNQDVSLQPHHFLPDLWCFPGHFLPTVAFSPGNEVVFRTFPFFDGTFSRKCGIFRDISILCTLEFSFSEIAVFKKSATL